MGMRSARARRRISELFLAALARLGDARPAQRVGAVHALELLAHEHPEQRQATVDVLCAYLRSPFAPRPANAQEQSVRALAQTVLARHLRPADRWAFWPGLSLELTGAYLSAFDLTGARVDGPARFDRALFADGVWLRGAVFASGASLREVTCHGHAWFERAVFHGPARLDGATFHGDAWFGETVFAGPARFTAATFHGHAWFTAMTVRAQTDLSWTVFRRSAGFRAADLRGPVSLIGATFAGAARVSRRRGGWSLCPPGWTVRVDPDNESVGDLVRTGYPVPLIESVRAFDAIPT